jgi:hypothetical protein
MQNLTNQLAFGKYFSRYFSLFDKRSYRTLCGILRQILGYKGGVQADMAEQCGKSVSALQYFFQYAKWSVSRLNEARLSVIRNKKETRDRETDLLVLDGCPIAKDKDSKSEFLYRLWDNRKKRTVVGVELFGAGIVTTEGKYYPLDMKVYEPKKWYSLYQAWISFLNRCLEKTKAKLVVIDRGFRNQYFLRTILDAGRGFLIRIDDDMLVLLDDYLEIRRSRVSSQRKGKRKRGRKKKFKTKYQVKIKKQITKKEAQASQQGRRIPTTEGLIEVIPQAIIKAWSGQIPQEGTIILYHRTKFKNPLVLYSSEADPTTERVLELIQCYYRRWKIEQIFKEEKQLFGMEQSTVTTAKALTRYLHIIMLAHTILSLKYQCLQIHQELLQKIKKYLKKKRKIPDLTLSSLKIFIEKWTLFLLRLTRPYPSHYQLNRFFDS